MDLGIAGRVILVTGASGGIGRAITEVLAAEGATAIAHGHRSHGDLARWCGPAGILTERADLSDPAAVDALFQRLASAHGRVDAVVANAGRWPVPVQRLDQTPVASLRSTLDDCLWTATLTARSFLATLAANGPPEGGSSLVFTGSTAAHFGEAGHAAYATAKAALVGLVRTLKNEIVEVDPRGRVNLVQPGWTATDRVAPRLEQPGFLDRVTRTMPLRRVADPRDIAHAVAFLSSGVAAGHITGEVLTISGGMEGRVLR